MEQTSVLTEVSKVAAEQLSRHTPGYSDSAKPVNTDVLDGSFLQLSICVFVVLVVLAVIPYNPTWAVTFSWGAALGVGSLLWKLFRWLLAIPFRLFGFGSGIVPGKLIVINCILTQVLIEVCRIKSEKLAIHVRKCTPWLKVLSGSKLRG